MRSRVKSIAGPLFHETLYYTESRGGNVPVYNGNISGMDWQSDGKQRGYDFTYDGLSRLTEAQYVEDNTRSSHYGTSYGYDRMGNVMSLKRRGLQDGGTYGLIDDLTCSYNGNQLVKVEDQVEDPTWQGAFNFMDGADGDVEYEYDRNGNLIKDQNKKISGIQYNLLNLPQTISYIDGKSAHYVYDAAGRKYRAVYTTALPSMSHTTDYCGNMIYEDGVLKQVLINGGYVTFNGTAPSYHFYLQDHLGNNRMVVSPDGTVEQVNHYDPFGGLLSESTGGEVQPYKYNGKELDRMHGLDWYDYGARHYDAALGRWTSMDPMAEKYYNVSLYAYCGNDPVNRFDPDGRDWYKDKDGTYQYSPFVHNQSDLQKGQQYLWKSHQFKTINYRTDGSIMYSNETAAYNRMWSQADKHYRQTDRRGREVGAFILKNGHILVLPDYRNDFQSSEISGYGYLISGKGKIKHGKEQFQITAQIHTHQRGSGDANPSFVGAYNDSKFAADLKRPVFTMSHDGNVWYIVANQEYQNMNITPYTLKDLLQGSKKKGSFAKYTNEPAWEDF